MTHTPHPRCYPEMLGHLEDVAVDVLNNRPPLHATLETIRVGSCPLPYSYGTTVVLNEQRLKQPEYDDYAQATIWLDSQWLKQEPPLPTVYATLLHELGHVFHLHGGRPYDHGYARMASEEAKAVLWAIGVASNMGMEPVTSILKQTARRWMGWHHCGNVCKFAGRTVARKVPL